MALYQGTCVEVKSLRMILVRQCYVRSAYLIVKVFVDKILLLLFFTHMDIKLQNNFFWFESIYHLRRK